MLPDHYATLGLERPCTLAQIRAAYRERAARYHPDRQPGSPETVRRMQELNAAHETLSDTRRRRIYDRDLAEERKGARNMGGRIQRNVSKDVHLPIEAFLRGTSLEVRVEDPASPDCAETYRLEVPPETAPGSRMRLPRQGAAEGGVVEVRLKALPGFRFKARGSDLRCDLRITAQRASKGGNEMIPGPGGQMIRITIPARVPRGEVLRVAGQGLPRPRGGRGDLLVRITYRVTVNVSRVGR